jgi:hypothetical protein
VPLPALKQRSKLICTVRHMYQDNSAQRVVAVCAWVGWARSVPLTPRDKEQACEKRQVGGNGQRQHLLPLSPDSYPVSIEVQPGLARLPGLEALGRAPPGKINGGI